MSSYSDADYNRTIILQNQIRMNSIRTLNPKPQDFLLNQSRRRIICLILILLIIYSKIFIELSKTINEVSLKDKYLRQQWLFEQEKIINQKRNLHEFLNNLKSIPDQNTKSRDKCFHSISKFYSKQILKICDKNQYTKEEYNQIVLPLQYLLAFVCLINSSLILIIFKKSSKFYFLSNILLILCLCIYAEFFLPNQPNVSYTTYLAWLIVIFTIYLLIKVFSTLFIFEHYQLMNYLQNNEQ